MEKEQKNITTPTKDATKRSSVAGHLVSYRKCAKKYNLPWIKIIHQCKNVTDINKTEAFSIYLEKPVLCK